VSPAPGRDRAPGRIRRTPSVRRPSAALVALELLDGISRAFRLHQRSVFAGEVREREIAVDPAKLAAAGLALDDVLTTAQRATALIGGGYIETPMQRIVIQAQAAGATTDALAQAVAGTHGGLPIRLGDVATIRDGAEPRFGDALIAGKPGILIETSTQFGANTLEV